MNWHAACQSLAAVMFVFCAILLIGAASTSYEGMKRVAVTYAALAFIAAVGGSLLIGLGNPA